MFKNPRFFLEELGYTNLEKIGSGSSSSIFKAKKDGEQIAVKCVNLPEYLRSYNIESTKLPFLYHPNIIEYKSSSQNDYLGIIDMELMETDLMSVLECQEKLDEENVKYIFFQICSAISYCHSKSFAHLDIKPENIFIDTASRTAKVGDWGSAMDFVPNKIHTRNVVGTILYCSPELINANYYPEKCDIWSLGILLHTMVTGKWPYRGTSNEEVFDKIRKGEIVIEKLDNDDLLDLLNKLLAINPLDRPSVDEILLHSWLSSVNPETRLPVGKRRRLSKFPSPTLSSPPKHIRKTHHHEEKERTEEEERELRKSPLANIFPDRAKNVYKGVRRIITNSPPSRSPKND